MSEDQKTNPEKLPKSTLADSIQKKDKEFDNKMSQYDNEIEEIKNNILGKER
ncbi:hypothetical protein [Sutcliffiella horikoshii]|uniref:hypothetical protein n=1 Tax=Sutcliffiella horikoshii TaxID=79883 RepID=UPI001CFF3B6F|nr:hypothetical protein [Sutcliffiella horikoshii]